jgi:iron complex transport system ATP-binding protein
MTSQPVLSVEHLVAGYGDVDAVTDITFQLAEGEVLGIVGPNGSGKSTLLKAITRGIPIRSGTVTIHDQPLESFRENELARRVSVIPQTAPLPEGFSALDVTLMGRTPHLRLLQSEGPSDLAIARRSMLQTDTLAFADRTVNELSGGERQRVVVARALTQQSPILLMDEPTVHLDIGHQIELLDLIVDLTRKQSLSVVTVVHDLMLAAQYCDRLLLLSKGGVYEAGEVQDVLTPDTIRAVYNVDVRVVPHPDSGRPVVLPIPAHFRFDE